MHEELNKAATINYPTIALIFNAPPRSGKDTLGRLIPHYLPGAVRHDCFKEALYDATYVRLEQAFKEFTPRHWWGSAEYDALKDDSDALLALTDGFEGTARECLIHVSEDIIKPRYGDGYFGEVMADKLRTGWTVITDGGFGPELEPVYKASDYCIVVRLSRDGFDFSGDSRNYIAKGDWPLVHFIDLDITGQTPEQSAAALGKELAFFMAEMRDHGLLAMAQAIPAPYMETFS